MKNFGFKKLMTFIILSATVALAYQLPYLKFTFYDQMMEALSMNDLQLGYLGTAVSFASTCSYPIGGYLAGKFSMKSMMVTSLAGLTACTIVFAFSTNVTVLIIVHALYGFFGIATLWSAYLVGIRGLGDESQQSKLFGSSEATRGILQTICAFVFLFIMNRAGSAVTNFRTMLLFGAAVCGLFTVLAVIFLPSGKTQEAAKEIESDSNERPYTYLDAVKDKSVWLMVFILMCAYMTWSMGNNYMTTYTARVVGLSASLASTVGIVRSYIIVFAAGFLGGYVMDKFKYKGLGYSIMLATELVLIVLAAITHNTVMVCVVITLVLAFVCNIMKATYWSFMGQCGITMRAAAIGTGFVSLIGFAPDFIVPTVCGSWLTAAEEAGNVAVGFNKIFVLMAVFAIGGIISGILLLKRTKSLEAQGLYKFE